MNITVNTSPVFQSRHDTRPPREPQAADRVAGKNSTNEGTQHGVHPHRRLPRAARCRPRRPGGMPDTPTRTEEQVWTLRGALPASKVGPVVRGGGTATCGSRACATRSLPKTPTVYHPPAGNPIPTQKPHPRNRSTDDPNLPCLVLPMQRLDRFHGPR
jgi:hypothetical protein